MGGLGQVEGGYVARVAGDEEVRCGCDSCQSCGVEEMAEEHGF